MANYAKIWASLSRRAVGQGGVNAQAFFEMAQASNMSAQEVERRLLADLDSDGPIFGSFLRQLGAAAQSTVLAAEGQGSVAAMIDGDEELMRLLKLDSVDDVLDDMSPDDLATLEQAAGPAEFTWIASLVNTCDRCLPLHGHTRTLDEWSSMGFAPETIHDGWASPCHCQLVPMSDAPAQKELTAPLKRVRQAADERGFKRTMRAIGGNDMDKAIETARRAAETPEGRRTLALLGQSNAKAG